MQVFEQDRIVYHSDIQGNSLSNMSDQKNHQDLRHYGQGLIRRPALGVTTDHVSQPASVVQLTSNLPKQCAFQNDKSSHDQHPHNSFVS